MNKITRSKLTLYLTFLPLLNCTAEELIFLQRPVKQVFVSNTFSTVDSICKIAPNPIKKIHYEGLLHTDSLRILTNKHLEDMHRLTIFYKQYASKGDSTLIPIIKDYVISWAKTYEATGNPINENKLVPVYYSYGILKSSFNYSEREVVENWLGDIAQAEIHYKHVPLNNWETKRIHMVGIIGIILKDSNLLNYAIHQSIFYIENALFADGTSTDIQSRDALSYHVSALKPLLQFMVALSSQVNQDYTEMYFQSSSKHGSVENSVDYVLPYAKGEKVYHQWVNTKVAIDKARAEANIQEYIPGTPYEKENSYPLLELASFFEPELASILPNELNNSWTLEVIQYLQENKQK